MWCMRLYLDSSSRIRQRPKPQEGDTDARGDLQGKLDAVVLQIPPTVCAKPRKTAAPMIGVSHSSGACAAHATQPRNLKPLDPRETPRSVHQAHRAA